MRRPLHLHPDGTSPAERVEVEIERRGPLELALTWAITGDIDRLRIPPPATPRRREGLWQHSCFEAFLRLPGEEGYCEFNLAPSGEWAAYGFSGYRRDMAKAEIPPPLITVRQSPRQLWAETWLVVPEAYGGAAWRLGLSAVLEEIEGTRSYWALTHPAERPDFHHPDCFAAEVAPPAQAL